MVASTLFDTSIYLMETVRRRVPFHFTEDAVEVEDESQVLDEQRPSATFHKFIYFES